MTNIAIKVENLSKCYQIYDKPHQRLLQGFLGSKKQYYKEFWALKDVSFEIKKGETVGIIGRNGSGKSTLLQMICGTLVPTNGIVETNGRIAALLELGSGFNPEFTGRENVFMNATILGLSQKEIYNRFDTIAAFADIGAFIEQPVKTYSSGMFVRLAFAVNILSEPDIMIVDEALAVGDMNFQAKCMTALNRIQENGTTILFVSHDVGAVKSLCSQGIYLERGAIKKIGTAPEVADLYIRSMREELNNEQQKLFRPIINSNGIQKSANDTSLSAIFKQSNEFEKRIETFRYGSGGARIKYAELLDEDNNATINIDFDQKISVVIYFETEIEEDISCNYYIADEKRNLVLGSGMRLAGQNFLKSRIGGKYIVTYSTRLPLHEGNYSIQLQLTRPLIPDQSAEFLDVVDNAIVFSVSRKQDGRIWTQVYLPNSVRVIEA